MKVRSLRGYRRPKENIKRGRGLFTLRGDEGKLLQRILVTAASVLLIVVLAFSLRADPVLMNSAEIATVWDHGVLRVGDSLSETGLIRFAGLPNFAPEILQRVRVKDPPKAKHLKKALEGLAEEGVTQLFRPELGSDFIVGAVGQLQFEVMADRLANEYALECVFEPSPYSEARWVGGDKADLEDFANKHKTAMARDIDDAPVFLSKSAWETGYIADRYPKVTFTKTRERM